MFILRLFLTVFGIFLLLMVTLGLSLWLKVRLHLRNPFLGQNNAAPYARDDNVIEGEYKVLDESQKDESQKDEDR